MTQRGDISEQAGRTDAQWIGDMLERITEKLAVERDRVGSGIPYTPSVEDGLYHDIDTAERLSWWTNGFWPGMLWQMFHATGEAAYREAAVGVERRFDALFDDYLGLHHDVGFMWLHTAVADYRLTGDADARRRGLHAANILAGRFNPLGGYIRSWNSHPNLNNAGWVIIDCMMNIPLLYWASEEIHDPRYAAIARIHADTVLQKILRPDGSSNHIAVLDPNTGDVLDTPGGQGYESGSSWSRGQAWALYGFALSHLHTKEARYLDAAKRMAHYFIANLAMNDWLPVVDFRAPREPVKYDSTAAMIAACGMLEIAEHVPEHEAPLYRDAAMRTLRACEAKFADWDLGRDGIIGYGTAAYHGHEKETHVPIIYGDYFFVEAVLRLNGKAFLIW